MNENRQAEQRPQDGEAPRKREPAPERPVPWLVAGRSAWRRYGAAILAIAAALLIDEVDFRSGGFRIYLVFYPFIMLATLYGGLGPGVLAIALSCLAAAFYLVEPVGRFAVAARADAITMAVFIVSNLFFVFVCKRLRRALHQAAQAEAHREHAERSERLLQEARAAKELAENANKAREQFIAVLSHELRTPLTPVLATVSAMEGQLNLSAEMRSDMELIHRNVELEAALIDDLLDVTRISTGKIALNPKAVDVQECLQAAVNTCRNTIEAKHLKLSINTLAGEHHVWADPVRLKQIFLNLLRNAAKFTPEGGRISVRSTDADGRLRVEIADTGVGIPPEVLPRIFNAFEQGETTVTRFFGGLGLGLSIAKALVDLHHGRLTALSAGKDMGSTFTVELATIPAVPQPRPPPSWPQPPGEQPLRILLVDDHADTLRIMAKLLMRLEYSVTTAVSVENALDLAARERFDLIVSDLGLPDGSGMDIIRTVGRRDALHGIAISGYGTEEDIRQSREAGFEEHLVKPVSFDTLRETIRRVVSKEG